jgi:SOS response regulatory protein OraA/RecX
MERAVIVEGARTPVGRFLGSFSEVPAVDLGVTATTGALERAGVDPAETDRVLARLRDEGALEDSRFARNRARALAERGKGDAAIRFDLEAQGLRGDLIEEAIADLESERVRAERIVSRRGASPATARLLAGRGFDPDVVEAVVAPNPGAAVG